MENRRQPGALIGSYSHILLDAFMHHDLQFLDRRWIFKKSHMQT